MYQVLFPFIPYPTYLQKLHFVRGSARQLYAVSASFSMVYCAVQLDQWESRQFIVPMVWHCISLCVSQVGFYLEP